MATVKKFDHRTELESFSTEVSKIKNCAEIFQQVEKKQKIITFLKRKDKEYVLKKLYHIVPRRKSENMLKEESSHSRSRRSSTKLSKMKIAKTSSSKKVLPKTCSLKISVVDIFREGLLINPKLKMSFLTSLNEMQPDVRMVPKDSRKNPNQFYQLHNIYVETKKEEDVKDGKDGEEGNGETTKL